MSTTKPPTGPSAETDKDVQALLLRLQCPTPLHVLRTLFLGNIASPQLDVSPMAPVAQAWGGEMPEFASTAEVEEARPGWQSAGRIRQRPPGGGAEQGRCQGPQASAADGQAV